MKRILLLTLALTLTAAPCVLAQETKPGAGGQKAAAGEVTLVGKISDDGKTFTADKDKKTLTLMNPDAVQGHAGHHVALSGHLMGDKIHVMSLKMAPEGKEKKSPAPKQ